MNETTRVHHPHPRRKSLIVRSSLQDSVCFGNIPSAEALG